MHKIAIITPRISHFEVPLFRLAASMQEFDVCVFHNDLRDDAFFDQSYGTTIQWGKGLKAGYPNVGYRTVNEMRRAVIDWSPNVALQYGYSWSGAVELLAHLRARQIPVIHRGLLTPYYNTNQNPLVTRAWRLLQPLLLNRFQAHHYGGEYSKSVLRNAGVPDTKSYFVPFSVDTSYFSERADNEKEIQASRDLRNSLGWSSHDPVLLFLCQHNWFKAPDVMLRIAVEAQRRNKSIKLIMGGSGSMTEELKTYASRNLASGSFHFPGYVSSEATMPYYLAADIVLFPSRYDTWSRGVNEAMLARRPCIVSRCVPAAGGLVEHGVNGYVVDGLAPQEFVRHLEIWLNLHEDVQTTMGQAARERAEFFSYEAHVDDLRRSFIDTARASSGKRH